MYFFVLPEVEVGIVMCMHVCFHACPCYKLTGKLGQLSWVCKNKISTPAGGHQLGVRHPGMLMSLSLCVRCGF